jgi:hypothetical protein
MRKDEFRRIAPVVKRLNPDSRVIKALSWQVGGSFLGMGQNPVPFRHWSFVRHSDFVIRHSDHCGARRRHEII